MTSMLPSCQISELLVCWVGGQKVTSSLEFCDSISLVNEVMMEMLMPSLGPLIFLIVASQEQATFTSG